MTSSPLTDIYVCRTVLINNVYKRRGASLSLHKKKLARRRERLPASPAPSSQSEAYVRSIRQSGHFDSYPALKLLLARRQHWAGEPVPESSETVIVKSLPFHQPQYYPGGREPLARLPRDPQVHNFRLEEAEVHRGFQETPRSSSLLAPIQNVLPEPVAAVPRLPVGSGGGGIFYP